jgi:hypothetical protein
MTANMKAIRMAFRIQNLHGKSSMLSKFEHINELADSTLLPRPEFNLSG